MVHIAASFVDNTTLMSTPRHCMLIGITIYMSYFWYNNYNVAFYVLGIDCLSIESCTTHYNCINKITVVRCWLHSNSSPLAEGGHRRLEARPQRYPTQW